MIKKFSRNVCKKIGHYIYLYIDPRNDEIFYVGKGENNRVFDHINDKKESEKTKRIEELAKLGMPPKIEILVHGISDDRIAKKIEASIIDLIGINRLTNIQKGYESKEFGRMSVAQLVSLYQKEEIEEIDEKCILIKINKSFRYGMSDIELYDATRSAWPVSDKKCSQVNYAYAVYSGVVQEIYKIEHWYPINTTLNSLDHGVVEERNKRRKEFVGNIAEKNIRDKYIHKDISKLFDQRFPFAYVNCK